MLPDVVYATVSGTRLIAAAASPPSRCPV